jgi:uncharacterized membrane protein YphA (DoxX/SURF4 family)
VGLLFLEHGTSKYLSLPVSPSTGVAPISLSGINGMIELVGGVLIVLGLFTRPVAFILVVCLIGDSSACNFFDNRWLWPNLFRSRRHRTVSGGVKMRCRSVNAA